MGSGKCFNKPKRACREAAFHTFQSIYITFRTISSYQRIDSEIALDSGECRQPARIRRTDETNKRHQERGSIHFLRTLELNKRTLLLVPEILVISRTMESRQSSIQPYGPASDRLAPDAALDRMPPTHEARVQERFAPSANFPIPSSASASALTASEGPSSSIPNLHTEFRHRICSPNTPHRIITVNIELELIEGAIANPNRPGIWYPAKWSS